MLTVSSGSFRRRPGAARTEIEKTLRSWSQQSAGMLDSASQTVQGAAQAAQEYVGQARDMASEQYGRAQELVRQRPAESVIVSFGTGCCWGLCVGLLCSLEVIDECGSNCIGSIQHDCG